MYTYICIFWLGLNSGVDIHAPTGWIPEQLRTDDSDFKRDRLWYVYLHIVVYVYICKYVWMYVYVCIYMYTYICIYIHICVYVHIYMCIYICTCIYIYI